MSRGNSNSNLWKDKYVNASSDKALNIFYDHLIALEKELSAAMLVKADIRAQVDRKENAHVRLNSAAMVPADRRFRLCRGFRRNRTSVM
jgi:hypothetical protein